MKLLTVTAIAVSLLGLGSIAALEMPGSVQQSEQTGDGWRGMLGAWPMGPGWRGSGPMPRHHVAMMWGIPKPYRSMSNPLQRTRKTLEKGAAIYVRNCQTCHGENGLGDGVAARGLSPPPGNLAWLSDMPISQWDSFMYWTIAEGGAQFGTDMPAFGKRLSEQEIWEVSAYIQAHLPGKRD